MVDSFSNNDGSKLLLPPAPSHRSSEISLVRVKKPVALQSNENAFIEKTLHYISSIKGAVKSGLILSTNTKFPTRYIIAIRGMPSMTIDDFKNIRDMNDHIRDIRISTAQEIVRIDIWRSGKKPERKKKRKRPKQSVVTSCDLGSVDDKDKKCLKQLLLRLNAMPEIECQFEVRVDTSTPEMYMINANIVDNMSLESLESILHSCRSFCTNIEFDFPHKLLRIHCLRLAAPFRRKRLILKN
jgi:hypothetical protein